MPYSYYQFAGMHLIWWILWVLTLSWYFSSYYKTKNSKKHKESSLELLKRRYASGLINKEEYYEIKKILNE